MATWTDQECEEAISRLVERATKDGEFRQLALAQSHEALRVVTGRDVPSDLQVTVVEMGDSRKSPSGITVLLPPFNAAGLSQAELAHVAAGHAGGIYATPDPLFMVLGLASLACAALFRVVAMLLH